MATVQPITVSPVSRFELKHILVTTDFSDCSRHALQQAAAIARLHSSDLSVLHVIPPEPMLQNALEPASWEYIDLVNKAQSEIKTAETEEIMAGIPHQYTVERGELEAVLAALIKEREISLLVVGTHGRGGIKKLLLGSVAEEMFRRAECPVLTVGPHETPSLLTHGKFQSVLFATDFSAGSMNALTYAVGFAQESQARLTLLHAVEEGSLTGLYLHERMLADARKRLDEMVPAHAGVAFPPDVEILSGYPVDAILRIAEKKKADLIVLGVHKTGGLAARTSSHLPWTIAQTVVCHAKCPVLTVRG